MEKIDLTYLESMSSGDSELIKEMISIFEEQIPEFIEQLNNSLEEKNWVDLFAIAHKSRSSVVVMGLHNLADILKTLEDMEEADVDEAEVKVTIDNFERVCNNAIVDLNKYSESL